MLLAPTAHRILAELQFLVAFVSSVIMYHNSYIALRVRFGVYDTIKNIVLVDITTITKGT